MQFVSSLLNLAREKGQELQQELEAHVLQPLQAQVSQLSATNGASQPTSFSTPSRSPTGALPHPIASSQAAQTLEERMRAFKKLLLSPRIDLRGLRALAFGGVPERDGLRAVTWKVRKTQLLGC